MLILIYHILLTILKIRSGVVAYSYLRLCTRVAVDTIIHQYPLTQDVVNHQCLIHCPSDVAVCYQSMSIEVQLRGKLFIVLRKRLTKKNKKHDMLALGHAIGKNSLIHARLVKNIKIDLKIRKNKIQRMM